MENIRYAIFFIQPDGALQEMEPEYKTEAMAMERLNDIGYMTVQEEDLARRTWIVLPKSRMKWEKE